jgi:hypothetical protein
MGAAPAVLRLDGQHFDAAGGGSPRPMSSLLPLIPSIAARLLS